MCPPDTVVTSWVMHTFPVQLRGSGTLAARRGSQNTGNPPSGGDGSLQGSLKQGRVSLESGRSALTTCCWAGARKAHRGWPRADPVTWLLADCAWLALPHFQKISFLTQIVQWHLLVALDMWVQNPQGGSGLFCIWPQGPWETNKYLRYSLVPLCEIHKRLNPSPQVFF